MNPALLKLLASLKIPAWVAAGCAGTVVVQHYTTSSLSSWDEKAARGKESSGQGIKFEISQLSKQLEEKEQSLKTWEEMLAKQAADLKEQQAAVSSVPAQTTTVKTVTESKLDEPVIDETPFGEEDPKNGKSKQSKSTWRGIAKQAAEALTVDIPRRPAVFDGGGTPAVAFPPTTDVVTVKETSDISERFEAELRAKDRALEALREQREEAWKEKEADLAKYEAELRRLDREKNALEAELKDLRTSNEDLKRKLVKTEEKLSKAKEESERLGLVLDAADGVYKDVWKKTAIIPEDRTYAVCRLKEEEASKLWNFFPPLKWILDACMNNHRKALIARMARDKKVDLSEFKACYTVVPIALYACGTSDPEGGLVLKDDKDYYSVRPQRWLRRLFCLCKKRPSEIRKLKYEEFAVDVVQGENARDQKNTELRDALSPKEYETFKGKKNEIINEWTLLPAPGDAESEAGYSIKGLFCGFFCSCKRGNEKHKKVAAELDNALPEEGKEILELKDNEIKTNGQMPLEMSVDAPNLEACEPNTSYVFFVFKPCSWLWGSVKEAWSACFGESHRQVPDD